MSVSGVDSSVLLCGRPYGGSSVLYRRNLASYVVPFESCSNRLCGIRFHDSTGLSMLLICVLYAFFLVFFIVMNTSTL